MLSENKLKDDSAGLFLNRVNTTVWLCLIIGLGVFLRLYKLDFKSLWIDELYSIVPVNPNNTVEFIIDYCKADQPPLFFLLLHYWFKITAYTPFFGRLLPAIFGVLSIIAMYFLGREIGTQRTGLIAGFLTAINYFHIYYSQELRFYSLLFLLATVSFIYFFRSLRKKNLLSYAWYVVSTVALLYTQYFGILVFVIQGFIFVFYVIVYKVKVSFILTGVLLAILISVSFIPWLPTLLYDSQISSYWIPAPKPYFFVVYYYIYWGKDVFSAILLLSVGSWYLWYLFRSLQHNSIRSRECFLGIALVMWILLSYGIPYFRSLASTPMLIPRYTVITLPAIFIIIALGFNLVKVPWWKVTIMSLVMISTIANLFFIQKHYTTHDKAQWREAAQAVIRNHDPGVIVYSNLEWWYNYYFYFTDPYIRVIGKYSSDEKMELEPFISLIEGEKKFWVLNGEGAPGLNGLQQAYVDEHFKVEKKFAFFAASAVLYSAK